MSSQYRVTGQLVQEATHLLKIVKSTADGVQCARKRTVILIEQDGRGARGWGIGQGREGRRLDGICRCLLLELLPGTQLHAAGGEGLLQ